MLVNMKNMLEKAKKEQYAVPHFNINNLEWTRFVLEECQDLRTPVILGVSEGAVNYMGGYDVVSHLVRTLIQDLNITIPVALHLDHGSSVEACTKALVSGFTSVMIDASRYALDINIRTTNEVVKLAKKYKASVESEIGHIGGTEDSTTSSIVYAQVDECIKFMKETKVDALAPALGSVHGLYKGEPNLDFQRMLEIGIKTGTPLVLHGGTGIPDAMIRQAIECGICKLNINTELQIAWAKAVRSFLNFSTDVYDPRKIIKAGEKAIKASIRNKVTLLGSENKVETPKK